MALIPRLNAATEELVFDLVLESKTLEQIAIAIGLKNRAQLAKYCAQYPDFMDLLDRARHAECVAIEEEVRFVAERYGKDEARIKLEALTKILKWRDVKKYGDKTQIDMSVSMDIHGSLERADRRVIEITATNVLALPVKKSP